MCSTMLHTCKNHKAAGQMGFRPVHGSAGHVFTGLMAWLNIICDETSRKFRHMLINCDQLQSDLSEFRTIEDMVIVHYDLKDFFMNGSAAFLAHHVSLVLPLKFRTAAKKAMTFLLSNQIICSRLFPG